MIDALRDADPATDHATDPHGGLPAVDDVRLADHPVVADHVRRGDHVRSDAELVAAVAERLAVPRRQPADSFVLHSPLELTARAGLLPWVRPDVHELARLRLASLALGYEAWGEPVGAASDEPDRIAPANPPGPTPEPVAVADGAARLAAAIAAGELDDVDDTAAWLGSVASPDELRRLLGPDVVPRLAAAAHGPIFLYLLPRVAPRGEIPATLLRGLARDLARNPSWRLRWIERLPDRPASSASAAAAGDAVLEALAATPVLGPPDSPFIFPLMHRVDTGGDDTAADGGRGVAAELLDPVLAAFDLDDPAVFRAAAHAVLRASSWSMLLEPDDHVPYGWSHCLTMPQAVLGIADPTGAGVAPRQALAVAAGHVVGFRASLARVPLVADPDRPGADGRPIGALAPVADDRVPRRADAAATATAAWLATRASARHDAHLVKHTLACLDAAAFDPGAARLHLAAAARLGDWWAARPDPDDRLAAVATDELLARLDAPPAAAG